MTLIKIVNNVQKITYWMIMSVNKLQPKTVVTIKTFRIVVIAMMVMDQLQTREEIKTVKK